MAAPGDICIDIVLSSFDPAYPIPDPYSWWRWLKWIEIPKGVLDLLSIVMFSSEKSSSARNNFTSCGAWVAQEPPQIDGFLVGERVVERRRRRLRRQIGNMLLI